MQADANPDEAIEIMFNSTYGGFTFSDDACKLYCKGKGVTATGYESSQGFVVKAGSQAAASITPSMRAHLPAVDHRGSGCGAGGGCGGGGGGVGGCGGHVSAARSGGTQPTVAAVRNLQGRPRV